MATNQIIDYTQVATPAATDMFVVQQGGVTKKESSQQIITGNAASNAVQEAGTSALTATTPANSAYASQRNQQKYCTLAGTNTYTGTLTPAITGYVTGMSFDVLITNASTGASTVNINSVGAKKVYVEVNGTYTQVGSGTPAGDIFAGMNASITYDSSLDGAVGGWVIRNKRDRLIIEHNTDGSQKGFAVAGTNTYTATVGIAAYTDKQAFDVVFTNASTGASTLNIDSLGAKKLYVDVSGVYTQVIAADIFAGMHASITYDSSLDTAAGGWVIRNKRARQQIVQIVETVTGAVATGTTTIPNDDTIPQITEGDQYLSQAITPTNTNNTLLIEAQLILSSTITDEMITALFQDATANALCVGSHYIGNATQQFSLNLSWKMTAGTTSATTFKIRAGLVVANTTTFNGVSGLRRFGGVSNSYIRIKEITP